MISRYPGAYCCKMIIEIEEFAAERSSRADCLIFHLSEGIGNSASDFTNSSLSGLSFFIWRIQTCGGERRASGQRHGRGADGASAAGTQRSDSCPATPPARPRLPAAAPSASARPRQRAKHQLSEGRRRHGNPGTKKGDSYVMAGSRSNVFFCDVTLKWLTVKLTNQPSIDYSV